MGTNDDDFFLVLFPVYIITHRDAGIDSPLPAVHPESREVATPVFTDDDLAQTFLETNSPSPDFVLHVIEGLGAFARWLETIEANGFSRVIFDPTDGKGGTRGIPRPIAELRAEALAQLPKINR